MKAWRLDAVNVNARRLAGSKEPTARVQKARRMVSAKLSTNASTWLLDGLLNGLLIRAGIIDPMPLKEQLRPATAQSASWWKKFKAQAKRWLSL